MKLLGAIRGLLASGVALVSVGCGVQGQSPDELGAQTQAAYPVGVLSSTKIWKVKASDTLNCRVKPGTGAGVVFELKNGSVLDVVDSTRVKKDGFTWIHVNPRGDVDHNTCYVAADDRWLKPANDIDADNYPIEKLATASVFKVKAPLNCRAQPKSSAPIIFSAMPVGTVLDFDTSAEFPTAWAEDTWWLHVNPRGDSDHNTCWVAARKSNISIVQ